MKAYISFASLASIVSAAGDGGYDYKQNGLDWPTAFPDCGLTNQSPINLNSAYDAYTRYDKSEDLYTKVYSNQKDEEVAWVGDTTKVTLNDGPNMFTSKIGTTIFGANPQWNAAQFHFHAGSEHTIDNRRYDFEMHTVHLAEDTVGGFGYAAVGIIFSVNEYTAKLTHAEQKIIDTFFDSVDLTKTNDPVQSLITYGDLMNMVDTDNRYVYKGSVTTPPCGQSVYWNVLSTVYPISQRHVDLFKQQLARADQGNLDSTGNWRAIQGIDRHNVIRVVDTKFGSELATGNHVNYNININIYNQGQLPGFMGGH